ncbi:MAG: hypothetical protein JWM27_3399 [Gemmatimonadetes bacterium]|nr:hypothetical protein [Gemmatimonadota bacterium]
MCNPFWSNILGASILRVDVTVTGGATVAGSVVTTKPDGTAERRTVTITDFPLALPIENGIAQRVSVHAASDGDPGTATVMADVKGDIRGPDICTLEVDENHLAAITTVTAIGG